MNYTNDVATNKIPAIELKQRDKEQIATSRKKIVWGIFIILAFILSLSTTALVASKLAHNTGYSNGTHDGYHVGHTDGQTQGYQSGFNIGQTQGYQSGFSAG